MAWIESHTVLLRHRKLKLLAGDLRIKPVYLLGHFHALWHSVLEQQEDGDLSSWTDDLIADLAGYEGDSAKFVSLLQNHGWLDGKLIHDWLDYAGMYLIKRYSTSDKDRLVSIWKKHGRRYGEKAYKASKKRAKSEQKANITIPNQPNLTKPSKDIVAAPPKDPPEHVVLLEGMKACYEKNSGACYELKQKDFVLAAELVKKHGVEAVRQKIEWLAVYCSGKAEAWFAKEGWADYTIGKVSACWNHILPRLSQEQRQEEESRKKAKAWDEHEAKVQSLIGGAK